eukprot:4929228-Amphidinium_carterae.1
MSSAKKLSGLRRQHVLLRTRSESRRPWYPPDPKGAVELASVLKPIFGRNLTAPFTDSPKRTRHSSFAPSKFTCFVQKLHICRLLEGFQNYRSR